MSRNGEIGVIDWIVPVICHPKLFVEAGPPDAAEGSLRFTVHDLYIVRLILVLPSAILQRR